MYIVVYSHKCDFINYRLHLYIIGTLSSFYSDLYTLYVYVEINTANYISSPVVIP